MANEIHCSACDAIVAPGSQFCPRCGLRLMAMAQPAVYIEKARYSIWAILGVCLVAFFIGANILSRFDASKAFRASNEFAAAVNSGALNTPAAFEARCGMPRWTNHTKDGEELHYLVGSADYYVTLTNAAPIFESEQMSGMHPYRVKMEPDDAFRRLACK